MDHSGAYGFVPTMGMGNHAGHPWVQAQIMQQPEEQHLPTSTIPSYVSQMRLPTTSYTQHRVINYNHESIVCEQQTGVGANCKLTIPIELLDEQSRILEALPAVVLKEIVFLGPHPASIQHFLNSQEFFIMKAMHILRGVQSLKKVTFSLDFTHFKEILEILAAIPNMQEIVLTVPTAVVLRPDTPAMLNIQNAFVAGLGYFNHVKRLTIPMELVTAFLLSFLAKLPYLESLTISYSPPPPSPNNRPFPEWSSYRNPGGCPGRIFLNQLNFDPRGYFRRLTYLDLGGPLSDSSYAALKSLFPEAHIC